jgi:hypothetical protein
MGNMGTKTLEVNVFYGNIIGTYRTISYRHGCFSGKIILEQMGNPAKHVVLWLGK